MHRSCTTLILAALAAAACSDDVPGRGRPSDGGFGAQTASCTTGTPCARLEDCPGVSCSCPGVRFPVTIQKCSGNCCAATCDEACPSSGAGGSGNGGATGTGGITECPLGTSDIEFDWMTPYSLGVGIMGTITLPSSVSPGRATQLSLEKAGPDPGGTQLVGSYVTEAGKRSITYHVKLVQDGNYYLSFGVDESNNGAFGDPGDLKGFWNGTVAAPIMTMADAPVIHIVGVCQSARDFGVGPVP